MSLSETKKYGVLLDTSLKIIKQDIQQRFKSANIDLTPEQWTLLDELASRGELSQKQLAESTFKDAPTVSRIVDLLIRRGYINRKSDHGDRRKYLISLTDAGQSIYQKSAPMINAARTDGWAGLTDDDFQQFETILQKLTSNILELKKS